MGMRGGLALVVAGALLVGACSDGGSEDETTEEAPVETTAETTVETQAPIAERQPTAEPATLEGPITTGTSSPPADPRPVDLAAIGYVEEEWFAAGEATSYTMVTERSRDGAWDLTPAATAPYRTRFVVRRPADVTDFSGTVIVEWLNVSAIETGPDWTYFGDAMVDAGAAWVGVSVQAFGINGGRSLIDTGDDRQDALDGGIRNTNPERYGTLEHPGDAFAFDIYSQVGAAMRSAAGEDVVGGAPVDRVVAIGESQSAGFLTSYINGVQPMVDVFDGFMVHSRGAGAAQFDGNPAIRGDEAGYRFRTDLDVPVLALETETDVGPLLRYALARQDDTDLLRVWEVAGTAHADAYLVGRDFPLCPNGINDGPQHWVGKAGLEALLRWIDEGVAPPHGDPIRSDDTTIERDERGLALGGIRTPSVDVPVSALSGEAPPGEELLCQLFGSSTPFTPEVLQALYPSRQDYLDAFDAALDEAVASGFVRSADREAYAAEARAVGFP